MTSEHTTPVDDTVRRSAQTPELADDTLVVVQDGAGRWLRANQTARRVFDLLAIDYCGMTGTDLAARVPGRAEQLRLATALDAQAWAARGPLAAEMAIVDQRGEIQIWRITRVPLYTSDGQRRELLWTGRSVTGERQSEDYLAQHQSELTMPQLAAATAHELRNPLAAIRWHLNLLRSRKPDEADAVGMMLSEIDRVDETLGDLMSLGRAREADRQSINLVELVRAVIRLMAGMAHRANVRMTLEAAELPSIAGNPRQLKQVLINLLTNALEATPAGGSIRVAVTGAGSDAVRIRMTDTGVGIPAEHLPRIGEAFFTTKPTGTGLGLMVCRSLVAQHRGLLTFHSQVGEGTVVDLTLPCAANGVRPAAERTTAS